MFQIPEFTSRSTNNDSIHTNCPVKYFAIFQFINDMSLYDETIYLAIVNDIDFMTCYIHLRQTTF